MKIAFFEIEQWEKKHLEEKFRKHNLLFFDKELSEKNIEKVKDFDIVSIFVGSEINNKLVNKFKNLKAIITRSTGYDHIDVKCCKKKKVLVLNTPYYGENTVAEFAFALILALSRKIVESVEKTKKRDFSLEGLRGFDLKDKTLGVVGMGEIGSHVVRIAKGFGMNVLVCTRTKHPKLAKRHGFKYATLDNLLKNSDIITMHVPLTKETNHLINKKNIKLVKRGAYLINTSRGEVVDTTALIMALDKGILRGAGLDVLEEEELFKEEKQLLSEGFSREKLFNVFENNILLNHSNVIITPHNAFNTQEALNRILETTVNNINSVIKGKARNVVK
jgi:D-lactate dehydrogenase|tara:strand:- start:3223 stop:4221 length:999 start_codon:yes stop_codon:yes gene_type:complete